MLGEINSIILFSIITLGIGHSLLWLVKAKRQTNLILWILETAAVGLATFSFLIVLLDLVRIPLHMAVFLGIAVIVPIISLIKSIREKEAVSFEWKREETICAVILLVALGLFFALFYKGAMGYPYLEDDDPWLHATSIAYVGREQTYSVDPQLAQYAPGYTFYIEPYPPTYDSILGIMWQANGSVLWTSKFFNVLLCTLALAFFYIFVKTYLESDLKALFATLALAALPSFMSHFTWSQTLALTIFPVALYAIVKSLTDDSWRIPAIVAVASELVTQPVVSLVFGLAVLALVLLLFLHELVQKRKKGSLLAQFPLTTKAFIVGAAGVLLSMLYWGWQFIKWGIEGVIVGHGGGFGSWNYDYVLQKYTFMDVFVAAKQSRIDQAIGWGQAIFLLFVIALILFIVTAKRTLSLKNSWVYWHMIAWFLITAYMVFGPTFGMTGYGSSRAWPYLALPLILIVTAGAFILVNSIAKRQYLLKVGLLAIIMVAIIATTVPAKIAVQTAQWPPGVQWTMVQTPQGPAIPDLAGYLQMQQTLPKNTRVFPFCGEAKAIGFDMQSDPWNLEELLFTRSAVNATGEQVITFLTTHNYEYFTIDAGCVRNWGENETQGLLERIAGTGRIEPVITQPGFLLARVR